MNVSEYMQALGQKARAASTLIASASCGQKNAALLAIATQIEASVSQLREANAKDLVAGKENGLDAALLDRVE